MSPSKQKIEVLCECGNTRLIRRDTYTANMKRNGVYLCHHCATIKAGAEGKFSSTFEVRSRQSKKLWQDRQFREKITATSIAANTTDEYRRAQSERATALWVDSEYAKRVASGVSASMTEDITNRISVSLKARYRTDVEYGIAVGKAARLRYQDPEYRAKMAIVRANQPRISGLQLSLYKFLDDLNVAYSPESPATAIGHYVFDCLIPTANRSILVECQGNYWHGLPQAQALDRAKFTYINKYFPEYEIMYVWEHEFATKDRVLDRLKLKLGLEIGTIPFSFDDVIIRAVDRDAVKSFLDQYHYIGGTRGGRAFGAFLNDELIACVLYSPPSRQNHDRYGEFMELSRFCIHPTRHVKNFATWLISRTIKLLETPTIVAYADTTVGHLGTIYKAANFRFDHSSPSDYWYVDAAGYVMHKQTLYRRAVNLKSTEAEFAAKYGYVKKFGGEKLCFIYNK